MSGKIEIDANKVASILRSDNSPASAERPKQWAVDTLKPCRVYLSDGSWEYCQWKGDAFHRVNLHTENLESLGVYCSFEQAEEYVRGLSGFD